MRAKLIDNYLYRVNATKIQLSAKELELINNAEIILTKNSIISKVYDLFGLLADEFRSTVSVKKLPEQILRWSPKIARGENYRGLPYVMLDFPRLFEKEDVFAIRTMFWWGNFFSITLHLKGKYKKAYEEKICLKYANLRQLDFYVCISEQEWQHHFENDNYVKVGETSEKEFTDLLRQKDFIKLSKRHPVSEWHSVQPFLEDAFQQIVLLCDD